MSNRNTVFVGEETRIGQCYFICRSSSHPNPRALHGNHSPKKCNTSLQRRPSNVCHAPSAHLGPLVQHPAPNRCKVKRERRRFSTGAVQSASCRRHHPHPMHIPCRPKRRPKRSPKKKRNKTFLHASLSKRNKTEDLRDGSCDVWKPGAEICFDAGRQLRSANAWVEL